MNKNKNVGIIVVTYNRKKLLKENLEALFCQTYDKYDIFVIDNNSNDGTKEYISEFINDEKIRYINTGKNLGGAGGFSYGMKLVLKENYDYVWLMDDDTIPTKNALSSLVKKAKKINDNFSYIGSLVKWTNNELCIMNSQVISKNWYKDYDKLYDGLIPINSSSFVSFFVNAKIANSVGIPIKEFFIYGDDWEYSERLNKKNKGYLDIDSIVIHKMSSNKDVSIVDIDDNRIDRCYYNYRNVFYIMKKYHSKVRLTLFILKYFYTLFQILFKAKSKKIKRIWTMTKGMFSGIFFNPKIEHI